MLGKMGWMVSGPGANSTSQELITESQRESGHWLDTQTTFYSEDPSVPDHGELSRHVVCLHTHHHHQNLSSFSS